MKDCRIALAPMTRELCHALFKGWTNDPAMYLDPAECKTYVYDAAAVDRYFDARQTPTRRSFAILCDGELVGGVDLKRIDWERGVRTLSIHLQRDEFKGKGYGTEAERLALRHAFEVLGMKEVLADAVVTNLRSRHVLEKVGFVPIETRDGFCFYRCAREEWEASQR